MPVSVDTLRLQLDYSAWASQRLMDAAAKLSHDDLTRDFKTADKTVLDTLVHIYAADRIWLTRVLGEPRATFVDPEDYRQRQGRKTIPGGQGSATGDSGAVKKRR